MVIDNVLVVVTHNNFFYFNNNTVQKLERKKLESTNDKLNISGYLHWPRTGCCPWLGNEYAEVASGPELAAVPG